MDRTGPIVSGIAENCEFPHRTIIEGNVSVQTHEDYKHMKSIYMYL